MLANGDAVVACLDYSAGLAQEQVTPIETASL